MTSSFQDTDFSLWNVYNQSSPFASLSPVQEPYGTLADLFPTEGWDTAPEFQAPYRNPSPPSNHSSHRNVSPPSNMSSHRNVSPPNNMNIQRELLYPSSPLVSHVPHMLNRSPVPLLSPVPLVSPVLPVFNWPSTPPGSLMLNRSPDLPSNDRNAPPAPLLLQVSLPAPRRGHNSRSQLVRRLEPLACVFGDQWVAECEGLDRPEADVVEVVTQLIQLDRIRQKKPEELRSIMRDTLSSDQLTAVLSARKRKMRKSAKQERTLSRRRHSEGVISRRYSGSILPLRDPHSNLPNY